jgi:tetratricopeptide (TPR) repeat protein
MILSLLSAVALATAAPGPACPAATDSAGFLCRAVAAADAQEFAEAAPYFERAAAASSAGDPRTQRMLAAAGNAWIAAGQPGKAALALDRALAGPGLLADQRGLALLDRARAAEAQNDLKGARRFVNLAVQSAAEDPFTWYFSSALAIREGDLPTARLAINRALGLAKDDPDILFEAGHVAKAEGKEAEARQYWQQAAAADPGGATGRAARQALGMVDVPLTVTTSASPAAVVAKDKK